MCLCQWTPSTLRWRSRPCLLAPTWSMTSQAVHWTPICTARWAPVVPPLCLCKPGFPGTACIKDLHGRAREFPPKGKSILQSVLQRRRCSHLIGVGLAQFD